MALNDVGIRITAQDDTASAFQSAQRSMAGLKAEAESLQSAIATSIGKFGSIALVIGAAFETASLKNIIDMGDRIDDLAEKTGISAKELSEWRYAAEVAGTPLEALTTGITKLTRNMSEAAGGNKQQIEVFKALGIELKNSTGGLKSANEMLGEMADKFASYQDGPEKAALAMKAFGKSGQDMIPILNKGAQGIADLRSEANRLGAVFGDDMAKASGDFNDNLKRVSLSGEALKIKVANAVLPTLNQLAEAFLSTKNEGSSFAETFSVAIGTGLKSIVSTITAAIFGLTELGKTFGALIAVVGAWKPGSLLSDVDTAASNIWKQRKEDAQKAKAEFLALQSNIWNPKVEEVKRTTKGNAPTVGDAEAAKEAASAYNSLNSSIQQRINLHDIELSGGRKLTEAEKFHSDSLTKIDDATTKLTAKERERLRATLDIATARGKLVEIQQREMKAAQDAYAQTVASQDETLKALRDEEDARNKIRLSVMAGTQSTQEAIDLTALEAKAVFETAEDRKRLLDYYRIELDLRKKIKDINAAAGLDQAGRDELIAIEEANAARLKGAADMAAGTAKLTNIMDSVDQTARAVWTNVWEGGVNAFQRIGQTIKSAVLDLLYQLTIKKWILQIGATVTGTSAMAQSQGSSGGMGSLFNMFKSSGSGWFNDFGSNLGGSIADFGTTMVDKGFTQLGTYVESFGLNVNSMSGTINTLGDGLGYLNSAIALSKGEWGKGIGSAIGTYFGGPIGSMIGSTIGSWIDRTFGGSTKPSIEGGYSTSGNPGTNGRAYTLGTDGMYYGGAIDSRAKSFVTGTATDYASIVRASGYNAGTLTGQAFIGYDGNGGSKGSQNKLDYTAFLNGQQIYSRYADLGTNNAGTGDQAMTDAAKEATTKAVLSALQATDLGPQLNKFLDSVKINGASLAEVTASLGDVTNYITFSNAVKNMPFDYLTNVSVEASKALIAAAGDIEKLGTNIGTYFELFGTQAEKQAYLTGNLSDGFKALGITLPKSTDGLREWYKAEVKRLGAMDLSIKANADAYNSILKLAGGVDAMANSADQAAATRQSWQDKIDLLNGTTTQAQLDMQRDLAGTTDETTKSLIRQYYAQKSAKDAADALTASLKAIEASRQSWQDQLDVLTGNATTEEIQLRKDLASTTDETTKTLIRNVYAEKARQKALAEATAAAATAMDNAKATFDRAINAERERLNALIGQKQTVYDTVKGVFDLLTSNVKDLYAQVASTAAMSASQGNAFITAALAMAKAGGVVPDQAQLSDAIKAVRDSIDTAQFTSQFEADRARLILAGQLSQLKDNAGDQLTAAERALNIAKDQLTALDELVQSMADMIDAANGIDTSIKSVGAAFAQLAATLATAIKPAGTASAIDTKTSANKAGGTASTSGASFGGGSGAAAAQAAAPYNYATGIGLGGSINTAVADPAAFVKSLDWGNPAAVEKSVATTADFYQQNGKSQADIARDLNLPLSTVQESMDLRGIPRFAIGTNYVPRDMFAQIHEGEAIVPKAYNPWASPGGYNNGGELVSAIRALGSRLANIESHTQATADATNTVATIESDRQMQPQLMQVVS